MKESEIGDEPNGCSECSTCKFAVCSSLDASELREFRRRTHFVACETVFYEQQISTSSFVVLDGVMRLYRLLPNGRRQIVSFALSGDLLGMNASDRHEFSADAIGGVTVCQMSNAAFRRLIDDNPRFLRRISELAVRELHQLRNHMVLLGRRSAEGKVATFLLDWRDRFTQPNETSEMVPLPMSRLDIADYLGLTVETVSRTFTKLERDGVIDIIRGGVSLLAPERAEALALV